MPNQKFCNKYQPKTGNVENLKHKKTKELQWKLVTFCLFQFQDKPFSLLERHFSLLYI